MLLHRGADDACVEASADCAGDCSHRTASEEAYAGADHSSSQRIRRDTIYFACSVNEQDVVH